MVLGDVGEIVWASLSWLQNPNHEGRGSKRKINARWNVEQSTYLQYFVTIFLFRHSLQCFALSVCLSVGCRSSLSENPRSRSSRIRSSQPLRACKIVVEKRRS